MALGLALAIAGLGLQTYGTMRGGRAAAAEGAAQRRAAESQAHLFDYNAAVAELQAADAIARGMDEESRFRAGLRVLQGAQRAATAAAGIDVGFGSAVDVVADTAFLGELDALTIRTNAAREAWGFEVEAVDLRQRAEIARREGVVLADAGRQRQVGATVQAAGTLAVGGASLLAQRYGWR